METLKKVVGLTGEGQEKKSGQEPVSGVQGSGTAGEPFDAGNVEENNLTGKSGSQTEPSGQEPVSGVQGAGTAEKPFDAGNLDDKADLAGKAPQRTEVDSTPAPESTNPERQNESVSTETPAETTAPKLEKKPTIGSSRWFTNANPFAKSNGSPEKALEDDPEPKATTVAQEPTPTTTATERPTKKDKSTSLPPNHLGEYVPPGQDGIVVDPLSRMPNHLGDDVPPGQAANGFLTDKGKGKAKMSPEQAEQFESRQQQDFPSYKTESSSISTRRESVSTQYTIGTRQTYSTGATGASIAGSSRRASAAVHIVTSQGKPITAGGVPLGLPAMEERERRLSFSVPEDPEHELTDTNTAKNTHAGSIDGSKYHDFANAQPAKQATKETSLTPRDAATSPITNVEGPENRSSDKLRRRSSIIHKAKDFGRRVRHSISK